MKFTIPLFVSWLGSKNLCKNSDLLTPRPEENRASCLLNYIIIEKLNIPGGTYDASALKIGLPSMFHCATFSLSNQILTDQKSPCV